MNPLSLHLISELAITWTWLLGHLFLYNLLCHTIFLHVLVSQSHWQLRDTCWQLAFIEILLEEHFLLIYLIHDNCNLLLKLIIGCLVVFALTHRA